MLVLRLQQAEEEIERLKKVEPLLRKELDICQEVSQYLLFLFFLLSITGIVTLLDSSNTNFFKWIQFMCMKFFIKSFTIQSTTVFPRISAHALIDAVCE